MKYELNAMAENMNGIYILGNYYKLQNGCDYQEIDLKEDGTYEIISDGFFTKSEIENLTKIGEI